MRQHTAHTQLIMGRKVSLLLHCLLLLLLLVLVLVLFCYCVSYHILIVVVVVIISSITTFTSSKVAILMLQGKVWP